MDCLIFDAIVIENIHYKCTKEEHPEKYGYFDSIELGGLQRKQRFVLSTDHQQKQKQEKRGKYAR